MSIIELFTQIAPLVLSYFQPAPVELFTKTTPLHVPVVTIADPDPTPGPPFVYGLLEVFAPVTFTGDT